MNHTQEEPKTKTKKVETFIFIFPKRNMGSPGSNGLPKIKKINRKKKIMNNLAFHGIPNSLCDNDLDINTLMIQSIKQLIKLSDF